MKRPSIRECRKLANRFVKLRKRLNLRQAELAGLLGIRREAVSNIENAKNYPRRTILVRFSQIEARQSLGKEKANVNSTHTAA